MTARRIKHARALERREEFFLTVKQGNLDVLQKVRDQRAEEEKRLKEELKQKKIEKSKKLAQQHKNGVQSYKPLPTQARKKINTKKEN